MAMTKTERAALEAAQEEARLAMALRFPTDPVPQPMTESEIKAARTHEVMRYGNKTFVAIGWFYNAHSTRTTRGCSDGMSHNSSSIDGIASQGMGQMYHTKAEALRALRHEKVRMVAKELAAIDMAVEAAEAEGE